VLKPSAPSVRLRGDYLVLQKRKKLKLLSELDQERINRQFGTSAFSHSDFAPATRELVNFFAGVVPPPYVVVPPSTVSLKSKNSHSINSISLQLHPTNPPPTEQEKAIEMLLSISTPVRRPESAMSGDKRVKNASNDQQKFATAAAAAAATAVEDNSVNVDPVIEVSVDLDMPEDDQVVVEEEEEDENDGNLEDGDGEKKLSTIMMKDDGGIKEFGGEGEEGAEEVDASRFSRSATMKPNSNLEDKELLLDGDDLEGESEKPEGVSRVAANRDEEGDSQSNEAESAFDLVEREPMEVEKQSSTPMTRIKPVLNPSFASALKDDRRKPHNNLFLKQRPFDWSTYTRSLRVVRQYESHCRKSDKSVLAPAKHPLQGTQPPLGVFALDKDEKKVLDPFWNVWRKKESLHNPLIPEPK